MEGDRDGEMLALGLTELLILGDILGLMDTLILGLIEGDLEPSDGLIDGEIL